MLAFGGASQPPVWCRLSESCLTCLSHEATVKLNGGCLSIEAPGGTTTVAVTSSPALESAPAETMELSVHRGLDAPGAGPLICSAWGRSILAVLCPPGLCLSWGEPRILGCVPSALCSLACTVGIVLPATQLPLPGASAPATRKLLPGPAL